MFGRRSARRGGGGGGGGLGLFLLAMEVYRFLSRTNRFYPVMLGLLGLNVVVHLRPEALLWPSVRNACISASKVWLGKRWEPLLYSAFTHGSDAHLYYNMVSFMWKAATLEEKFGSAYFFYMTSVFTALTGGLYVAIGVVMNELFNEWSYMESCAVGFSGVIFALKVVTTHLQPPGMSSVMGIPFPSRIACWVELVLISVLVPNASFVGHLAGILVGLAFVWGPLKFIMDIPWQLVNSVVPRAPGGGGGGGNYASSRRYNDSARATGYRQDRNTEEEELQEALQQSREQYWQERQNVGHNQDGRYNHEGSQSGDHIAQASAREPPAEPTEPQPPSTPPPPTNPDFRSSTSSSSSSSSNPSIFTSRNPNSSLTSRLPNLSDDGGTIVMHIPSSVGQRTHGMPSNGGLQTTREEHVHHRLPGTPDDRKAVRAARIKKLDRRS